MSIHGLTALLWHNEIHLVKGLLCVVQVPMLGKFRYMGKPDKMHTAPVECIIHMFVMHVAEELHVWPEMAQRQRFWVSLQAIDQHISTTSAAAPCLPCDIA